MEVITDCRPKGGLVATIRMLNVIKVENVDLFGEDIK